MASAKRPSVVRTRQALGLTVCPNCKKLVDNKFIVECIKPDRMHGKRVCWECGFRWAILLDGTFNGVPAKEIPIDQIPLFNTQTESE